MKKTSNPYLPFERFIFRTPLLAFNTFIGHLAEISVSDEYFKKILTNNIIQESIYLASPVLFEELLKYLEKVLPDKREEERIRFSLLRYLGRMSTRCTPFGLFAGCSIGHLSEQTDIFLDKITSYQRHTSLDMSYLCALSKDLAVSPEIKSYLRYFCNTSIYRIGDKIRYVEYFYRGTKRVHRVAAVDYSVYLEKILQGAEEGQEINELAELIVDDEISMEEALSFIDELIHAQLLVNEMEPAVTGDRFLHQVIQKLGEIEKVISNKRAYISNDLQLLKQIDSSLKAIDGAFIGNTLPVYCDIIEKIKKLETVFEPQYLFQTDMVKPTNRSFLGKAIVEELKEAIAFLNKITVYPGVTNLSKFREAFSERYEDREMPLAQVLDMETGIGYIQTGNAGDLNPLVDDLMIPSSAESKGHVTEWNPLQPILLKKYLDAKLHNQSIIELADKDFEHLDAQWTDLPLTISVMCRILQDDENGREVYLKTAGGSSAANLLGRFCYTDKQIEEHVLKVAQKEQELMPDVIFAEIAHLPESRTGNILLRPVLRQYEIPYLVRSGVKKDVQIPLSDLMVSVRNGRIMLRSKRLNKEVIPRLSTAHNYSYHALPVYHFLCDMQTQNRRSGVGFNWGAIGNGQRWLPRVKYNNIILSSARWLIKHEEVKQFMETEDDKTLLELVANWRQAFHMPEYVVLEDGDNELFVDLTNSLSIRTLFSIVKKRSTFQLEEFLYHPQKAVVNGEEGAFTNEFILSFYKEKQEQ